MVELQVAGREEGHAEEAYRVFTRRGWPIAASSSAPGAAPGTSALDPANGAVAASCGVVVTAGRGRFQVVDTAEAYRRRGICSRLVVEASHRAAEDYGAERFVIVAEADYHALGLYESLGFERREHVFGVCFWERTGKAAAG